MKTDTSIRRYRFIEVLESPDFFEVTKGWLQLAEDREPGTPKALLEGIYILELPDGSRFKEVTYKTEHSAVEAAIADWATSSGRRYGRVRGDDLVLSDGTELPLSQLRAISI